MAAACGGDPADPGGPAASVPDMPMYNDPMCLPVDDPMYSPQHTLDSVPSPPPAELGYDLGHAMDLVTFGPLEAWGVEAGPDHFREIVVGAPALSSGAFGPGQGRVRWLRLNESTATFDPPSAEPVVEFESPFPCCSSGFGAAVLAADWAAPFNDFGGQRFVGQEVLVGAPWAQAGQGRVVLYRSAVGASDVPSSASRSVWSWSMLGIVGPPALSSAPMGFGTAMAAATDAVGPRTDWVAISAPGAGAVYLFRGETPPGPFLQPDVFTHFQTIDLTADLPGGFTPADLRFGAALVADDFDRDGRIDLAIGAPSLNVQVASRVFVIGGDASGGLETDDVVVITTAALGSGSGLGSALAVGETHLFPVQGLGPDPELETRRMLYMGAPDTAGGLGGLCWLGFAEDLGADEVLRPHDGFGTVGTPNPQCASSPLGSAFPTARWGASVLVGNLSPVDPYLDASSPFARLDEVAVGAPLAPDFAWELVSTIGPATWVGAEPTLGPSGLVTIHRGTRHGPWISPVVYVQTRPLGERFLTPDDARNARFGTSLLEVDVKRSGRPDLVVGAPGWNANRGAIQLLNSRPLNGMETSATNAGIFNTVDSDGNARSALIIPRGDRLLVQTTDAVNLTWREGDGSACVFQGTTLAAEIFIDQTFAHALGGGPSDITFCLDARDSGAPVLVHCDGVSRAAGFTNDEDALKIQVLIDDASFDNADPSDDTVTMNVLEVWVWAGIGAWLSTPNRCSLTNNPFVFTRASVLVETCE